MVALMDLAESPLPVTSDRTLVFTYKNWRGEVRKRNVIPVAIWFGSTKWHNEPQMFLRALEPSSEGTDENFGYQSRDFAIRDMSEVKFHFG